MTGDILKFAITDVVIDIIVLINLMQKDTNLKLILRRVIVVQTSLIKLQKIAPSRWREENKTHSMPDIKKMMKTIWTVIMKYNVSLKTDCKD